MHPDDEEFYTGTWADQFATYQDACDYYGCDGPAQLAAEAKAEREEWETGWIAEYGPFVVPPAEVPW